MTVLKLTHSFQPLDNKTPDIIEKNGKRLDSSIPHEQGEREKFVSIISNIAKFGNQKRDSIANIVIYYTKHEFVIETIPEQKDSLDRIAPIISYGKFPDDEQVKTDWIDDVVGDIGRFASSIDNGLTFTNKNDTLEKVKLFLTDIWNQKKRKIEELDFLFRLAVAVMIPLALVLLLLQIPQTVQQQIPQPLLNYLLKVQILQPVQKGVPQPSLVQVALFFSANNALIISLLKIKISKLIR